LPFTSEPNESLEQPLLHIFSFSGDVRFSSLWEIYYDNISTHQRVERSSIPNKDAHQSRLDWSYDETETNTQFCLCVCV